MKSTYTIFAFFIVLLFACKADKETTSPEPFIHSSYYLRYMEDEGQLKTEAAFRQGDSLQNAVAKTYSGVFFNDQEMAFKKLSDKNQRYLLTTSGAFPEDGLTFSFINDKGQRESQKFSLAPMQNLRAKGPVSKSKGASIIWEGEALGAQESVICLFSDKDNRTTNTIIKGPTDGAQIKIPFEKMSALTIGNGKLYLVRKNRVRNDLAKRSSFAVMEYYTAAIDIEVGE